MVPPRPHQDEYGGGGGLHLVPFAVEQSIPEQFEAQVAAFPDRLAIKTRRAAIDYQTLNRWANRVSHALIAECGTGPSTVALLLERDAPQLAAIFGALKAGKTYVPIDPTYPAARNRSIVDDSQATLIVTDRANADQARVLAGETIPILDLDTLDGKLDESNPGVAIAPDAYAYILYTSGSTGRPKGLVETHRNLLHNIRNFTVEHAITPDDRITGLHSFAFSGCLRDIYGSLLNGASLFLIEIERVGLHGLADWLIEEQITVFVSVATTFRHLARAVKSGASFPRLRLVRVGAEEVTWEDVALFKAVCSPGSVMVNGYGSTETGTSRTFTVTHRTEPRGASVPIGYPVAGMEVLLLDDDGQPVGFDQVGQIAVRSAYFSACYWKQPELTRRVFLLDPEGGDRRIYLTGDLGVMAPDGCLTHVGRKDFQVKVRGHRIEVSEIEAALRASPGVHEAVVVAREELPRDSCLVAYLVASQTPWAAPTTRALRGFLKSRLPAASVPSRFVFLESLPLTPSGKVDRKGLPAPDHGRVGAEREFVAPRDELESRLVAIWEELTQFRPIGVVDDFFEIGGDSLLAVRLFSSIHEHLGKSLPFETLITAPTIERLAEILSRATRTASHPLLIALKVDGTRLPFFGVPGSGAHPLSLYELARRSHPDQPFFALRYPEPSPDLPCLTRVEEMAARFLPEIRKVQPAGPYRLGGHSFGGIVAYEMAQQLVAQGEEVSLLALFDTWGKGYPAPRSLSGRLVGHLEHLRLLTFLDRFRYLARKTTGVIARVASLLPPLGPRRRADPTDTEDSTAPPDFGMINHLAWRRYEPQPFPGRLVIFRSEQTPDWIGSKFDDMKMGWGDLAAGSIEVRVVEGDHLTLLHRSNVDSLANELDSALGDEI